MESSLPIQASMCHPPREALEFRIRAAFSDFLRTASAAETASPCPARSSAWRPPRPGFRGWRTVRRPLALSNRSRSSHEHLRGWSRHPRARVRRLHAEATRHMVGDLAVLGSERSPEWPGIGGRRTTDRCAVGRPRRNLERHAGQRQDYRCDQEQGDPVDAFHEASSAAHVAMRIDQSAHRHLRQASPCWGTVRLGVNASQVREVKRMQARSRCLDGCPMRGIGRALEALDSAATA